MQENYPEESHFGMVQVAGGAEHSLVTFVESWVSTVANYLGEISV